MERELAAAKSKLAGRVDGIAPAQVEAFVKALESIPKVPVEIAVLDEPEPIEFGELVVGAFRRVKWPIVKAQKHIIWFPTTNGVHLEVASLPGPEHCEKIVAAFAEIGIDNVRILVPERLPESGFRLFIGRRLSMK